MTYAPGVPKEEPRFADNDARAVEAAATSDRRDPESGALMRQPARSAVNPDEPGRLGDLKQNLTNHWKVRESATHRRD